MATQQIVCTVNIDPIIAQAFIEGQGIDSGMSQSLLVRILRDHLQGMFPDFHVSVGLHDSAMVKLRVHRPQRNKTIRGRVRERFNKILQRENWLVSL